MLVQLFTYHPLVPILSWFRCTLKQTFMLTMTTPRPPPAAQLSSTLFIEAPPKKGSSSSTSALTSAEPQFKSLKNNTTLQNIMKGPSLDDIPGDSSSAVKRKLTFEDTPDKGLTTTTSVEHTAIPAIRTPKVEDQKPSPKHEQVTQNKKPKGKDHEEGAEH